MRSCEAFYGKFLSSGLSLCVIIGVIMSRYGDYGGWQPYVSVAQRRLEALQKINKLRKAGKEIEPIEIGARKPIAKSFWGKGWCDHVESFRDFSNRLPRGRTYARNGSVCHLGIGKGQVEALVSGSALYEVEVEISQLPAATWKKLQARCHGHIGSLVELLQGRLSHEIMGVVTDQKKGLFPSSRQITYSCNCPDWASMCKHVAAVIYGIGARLDTRPELLFLLRGVDHEDLISAEAAAGALEGKANQGTRRRTLATADLGGVFGVDLEHENADKNAVAGDSPEPRRRRLTARKRSAAGTKFFKPTGRNVAALRARLGMSKAEFARAVGVSAPSVTNWENTPGQLKLQLTSLKGLRRLSRKQGR